MSGHGPILPIVTSRLTLREFVTADIPSMISLIKHPHFGGYRQFRIGHIEEDVMRYLGEAISAQTKNISENRDLYRLAVCLHEKIIGCCVFSGWRQPNDDQLGYFFHPDYQKQGFAFEAAQALVNSYWREYPNNKIFAIAHPDNRPSIKILSKLGFKEYGKKTVDIDGQPQPRTLFAAQTNRQRIAPQFNSD